MGTRHEENTLSKRIIKMANKLLKRCSVSLAIKGTQIKTTMKYHYTTTRLARKKNDNAKDWWGCMWINPTLLAGMLQPLRKIVRQFLKT